MRMYDFIEKKKTGQELNAAEITYMIKEYVAGTIPDYQMSAMLMAIYFQGLTDGELANLTSAMAYSGETVDLSPIEGIKVDKHSTGGVGDKTTLIVGPIVAACGGKVAKMSGRGLGFTGGTIDKLESIPGFRTNLSLQEFFDAVNRAGICVIGQSADLAPADKLLYALRDVTATVDSIPLIAASVMSKKLACGSDKILLDVTCGSGAFMKNKEDAALLAKKMVEIGEKAGKPTVALITDMDVPLGCAVGNSIEIKEAAAILAGDGPQDLRELSLALASEMLYLADMGSMGQCRMLAEAAIQNGSAFTKLKQMVEAQGGDSSVLTDTDRMKKASFHDILTAERAGYIQRMDTRKFGHASVMLGAGRMTKECRIDPTAGLELIRKTGDYVQEGETLAVLYTSGESDFKEVKNILSKAYRLGKRRPVLGKPVIARVSRKGTIWY